jgi:hypothetical protein
MDKTEPLAGLVEALESVELDHPDPVELSE